MDKATMPKTLKAYAHFAGNTSCGTNSIKKAKRKGKTRAGLTVGITGESGRWRKKPKRPQKLSVWIPQKQGESPLLSGACGVRPAIMTEPAHSQENVRERKL